MRLGSDNDLLNLKNDDRTIGFWTWRRGEIEGRDKSGRKEIDSDREYRTEYVKAIKIPAEFIESFLRFLFRSWIRSRRQPRNYIILEHQAAVNYGFIGAA